MKLTIGFSPCPNDTFIFDALVNGGLDTGNLRFEPQLEDIQTLNAWALEGRLDITKLSFPAYFPQAGQYSILNAGAALGNGVGPLLVAKGPIDENDFPGASIAIPGEATTANFLLSYAFPQAQKKVPMLFSRIEEAVGNGETDMGVIIHENRFTYQQKGLYKLFDLGEIWEQREQAPIPLAGIAIRRSLPPAVIQAVDRLIKESVEKSFRSYPVLSAYTKDHAQAMDEDVMRKHIQLYVNDFSIQLGERGKAAISKLADVYSRLAKTGQPLSPAEMFV